MEKALHLKIQLDLYDRLKKKAAELNVSMGSIVRIALSEYLKEKK